MIEMQYKNMRSVNCFVRRYKDARTTQALEGTLQAVKFKDSRAKSLGGGLQASRRLALHQRRLKPRLFMAERGRQAAKETSGLLSPLDDSKARQSNGSSTAATADWDQEEQHYLGATSAARSPHALRSSKQKLPSQRGSVLESYMQRLSRSPSASLQVQQQRPSRRKSR